MNKTKISTTIIDRKTQPGPSRQRECASTWIRRAKEAHDPATHGIVWRHSKQISKSSLRKQSDVSGEDRKPNQSKQL